MLEEMNDTAGELPVLPLESNVIFPHTTLALTIRGPEAAAIAARLKKNATLIVLLQKEGTDGAHAEDFYHRGTVCAVTQMTPSKNNSLRLTLRGLYCADVDVFQNRSCLTGQARRAPLACPDSPEKIRALVGATARALRRINKEGAGIPHGIIKSAEQDDEPPELIAYVAAAFLPAFGLDEKQALLEKNDLEDLHETVLLRLENDRRKLELIAEIRERVIQKAAEREKKYLAQEMIDEIRKTINQDSDDFAALETRIKRLPLSEEARQKAEKDLGRLRSLDSLSPERSVLQTNLETLLDMPWGKSALVNTDTAHARDVLDEDHYGLAKVKEKITGYLAVQKRLAGKNGGTPQIMCLVGPPGIGKTSICQSIARATNRPYVRLALGGVSDEAEIRGHRRAYIGAAPGSVAMLLKKSGFKNPVFVLDEIDKVTPASVHGDPAAALLELLDPEQNKTFRDRYLDVSFDMSDVLFIATANVWENIPSALRDRMETVFLGSYTEDEKLEIAKRHLVPKKMAATGLDETEFSISSEALTDLIRHYTMEAGVRELERRIGQICMHAVTVLEESSPQVTVTRENLEKFAGRHLFEQELSENRDKVGMAMGLAWTEVGGSTLPIESVKFPGKGTPILLTGNLGQVISESAQVALSLAREKAGKMGYKKQLKELDRSTIHLHMPEGAIPKDGPSAGTVMLTALFSVITERKVRGDVAMTGEVNLSGAVLPIGGLREKLTAAARAGCRTVLIPKKNEKDLEDVPRTVRDALEIIPVSNADEVLKHALVNGGTLPAPKAA